MIIYIHAKKHGALLGTMAEKETDLAYYYKFKNADKMEEAFHNNFFIRDEVEKSVLN